MLDPARFVDRLRDLGLDHYMGVPDSLLKPLCSHIMAELPRDRHVITANEGAAVGVAIGHYLRTGRPAVVYLQNSGFGNMVNPLLSLADPEVYGIPMLLLVGWRGEVGVKDEPQHVKQGRIMEALLDAMELPWAVLPRDENAVGACLDEAVSVANARLCPYVVLVRKGTFAEALVSGDEEAAARQESHGSLASREESLAALIGALGDDTVNISTTGMLSRELFAYRERSHTSGVRDFLTVGGMGHCNSIALGVAMSEPDREVWCLDGDGAMLMHLGTFAVIADHGPSNLFHVVFNNGVHDSVGGQPTSIGVVDVAAVATALGYRSSVSIRSLHDVRPAVARLREVGGPALLEVRVRPGNRPGIGRPTRTPADSKSVFMSALGGS